MYDSNPLISLVELMMDSENGTEQSDEQTWKLAEHLLKSDFDQINGAIGSNYKSNKHNTG